MTRERDLRRNHLEMLITIKPILVLVSRNKEKKTSYKKQICLTKSKAREVKITLRVKILWTDYCRLGLKIS